MTAAERIAAAVAAADFGTPTARKAGRDSRWPYVPIIDHGESRPLSPTTQLRGLAYATRGEAVAAAERHVARARAQLAEHLGERRYRALREQHGLPRELDDLLELG